jgi:hypothetical protein
MRKYKYNGEGEVELTGVSIVQPGQVFETDKQINNPDCVLLEGNENTEESSKRKKKYRRK